MNDGIDQCHAVEQVGFQCAEGSRELDGIKDESVRYVIDKLKSEG